MVPTKYFLLASVLSLLLGPCLAEQVPIKPAKKANRLGKLSSEISSIGKGFRALKEDVSEIKTILMNLTFAVAQLTRNSERPRIERPTVPSLPTARIQISSQFESWFDSIGRPNNWTAFPANDSNSCFYKRFLIRSSFDKADCSCRRLHSHLASVHSAEENTFIKEKLSSDDWKRAWFGGTDRGVEGRWRWNDGTRFNFTYWLLNEPNDQNGEDCLEGLFREQLRWNDIPCSFRNDGFICKRCRADFTDSSRQVCQRAYPQQPKRPYRRLPTAKPILPFRRPRPNPPTPRTTPSIVQKRIAKLRLMNWIRTIGKPANWTSFQAPRSTKPACFYKRFLTRSNFRQAEDICFRHQSHLASIHSAEEQAFVKNQLIGNNWKRIWIGGNDRLVDGQWRWTDGTSFGEFTYWLPNEPNNNGGNEDCLETNFGSLRKWNDESCYSRLDGFVCKRCEDYRTTPRDSTYQWHLVKLLGLRPTKKLPFF